MPSDADLSESLSYAARVMPHAEHADVTRVRRGVEAVSLAATTDVGPHMTALQQRAAGGACADAATDEQIQHVPDFVAERRWPKFAALVLAETPIRSMIAFPMRLGGEHRGALAVYSTTPHGFDDADLELGPLVASYLAAVTRVELEREKVAQLETALETSRQIGAAMGIIMVRELLTFDQAFERLRSASQRLHRKLRDIAAEVVDTGRVPE